MKNILYISTLLLLLSSNSFSQCAICTKTAENLDEKSARGLNGGILYLAFMPITLISIIGYRWWKYNRQG